MRIAKDEPENGRRSSVTGKPADPLEDRLKRIHRLANQLATMHGWLSDRY